jgi:hypothetical protein
MNTVDILEKKPKTLEKRAKSKNTKCFSNEKKFCQLVLKLRKVTFEICKISVKYNFVLEAF